MTERTYKKDIEVIAENFHRELTAAISQHNQLHLSTDEEPAINHENESLINLADLLFTHLIPIYKFHVNFLRQLEQRISIW